MARAQTVRELRFDVHLHHGRQKVGIRVGCKLGSEKAYIATQHKMFALTYPAKHL
jgi:hypothetical protein